MRARDLHVHSGIACECHFGRLNSGRAALAACVTKLEFTEHCDCILVDPAFDQEILGPSEATAYG